MEPAWITGIGVVSPLGVGTERFWEALVLGRSAVAAYRPDGGPYASGVAARVAELATAPGQARGTTLALAAARLALADAGLGARTEAVREGGIYVGEALANLALWEACLDGQRGGSPDLLATSAAHLARAFGLEGEAITLASGCIGGLAAIGRAARDVRSGRVGVALAGASDSTLSPFPFAVLCKAKLLTPCPIPERAGRPFDVERDGEVTAEGAAFLALESASAALARGARRIAVVRGFAMAGDAYHFKYNKPGGSALARAARAALDDAGLTPDDVDLVLAHASGFKGSDAIEIAALGALFAGRPRPLPPVVSIKGATGQPFSAGGATQAAAAALALDRQTVPPTAHFDRADPEDPFDHVRQAMQRKLEVVLLTSYGYGGGKAALVITRQ
jgi:3-oxoacyl-[acyl-carrier-protein] synthase II